MIEERTIELLKKKTWTFSDISNVNALIETLAKDIYDTLDAKSKLDLIWNKEIQDGEYHIPFGQIFQENVMDELNNNIAVVIKEQLKSAKINFNEDDTNEIPKRSLGGKPLKRRTPDEKSNSEK